MATGTGLSVRGEFTVGEHHQGSPGVAHGGVLATAMDESLGYLNWLVGAPAVTARLQVDYKRPVPVGTTLFLEAEVTGVRGRKVYGRVVARLDATDGAIAVEATALFVQVSVEHFISAGNPELIERAFADRAEGGPGWRTGEHAFEVSP
jgi:acyl-coenzyme A thioesterase PaaI-like protein